MFYFVFLKKPRNLFTNKDTQLLLLLKDCIVCVCVCVVLSDLLLCGDGEFVTGDEAAHLLQRKAQELLSLHHLAEMLL